MNPALSERGAAVYTPLILKLYDWWVLGLSNRFAWKCSTSTTLLPFFQKHIARRHLDVGVGTGFYLAHARISAEKKITLLDLNENSLHLAAVRSRLQVDCVRHDIMQPLPLSRQTLFDSISLFYLLHCLPGTMVEKEKAIRHLKMHLTPSGTFYGATILGDTVHHNWFGRKLMAIYNRKGIFSNKADSMESLADMLRCHFEHVEIEQHGKVALFIAQGPLLRNE